MNLAPLTWWQGCLTLFTIYECLRRLSRSCLCRLCVWRCGADGRAFPPCWGSVRGCWMGLNSRAQRQSTSHCSCCRSTWRDAGRPSSCRSFSGRPDWNTRWAETRSHMLYTTVTSKQENICIVNINRVVLSEIHAVDGLIVLVVEWRTSKLFTANYFLFTWYYFLKSSCMLLLHYLASNSLKELCKLVQTTWWFFSFLANTHKCLF